MGQAIEMFFDDHADAAIRAMWQRLADAGLPSLATFTHRRHRPHVSLTVTESPRPTDLAAPCGVLAGYRPALQLAMLGTFPGSAGVLFLGAAVTADLLALHTQVHHALAGQPITHWPHYLPGTWVPHCTLAMGLDADETGQAFRLLHGCQPIAASIASAGIVDTITGAVTPLTA